MKFLFHIVANKQCGNPKLYIWYTHIHVTTVGKAGVSILISFWQISNGNSAMLATQYFVLVYFLQWRWNQVSYKTSPTSLSWIQIQICCEFVLLYPQYVDMWGITKCAIVSDEYCPWAATSPFLWPFYVFKFIVTALLLLLLCTIPTKFFLFLLFYIWSLQLSDSCLIYGSPLQVQATVVLFFFYSLIKPAYRLPLSYVFCLHFSNCCCSRTSYILQSSEFLCLLRHSAFCLSLSYLDYPWLHYRCCGPGSSVGIATYYGLDKSTTNT